MFSPVKTDNYTTYVLDTIPCPVKKYNSHITLFVTPVEADPFYNTDDMAYTKCPHQVDYFAKNKWAETPARMLQPLIVQTLQNTHHFHAITTSRNAANYNYVLNTKILELRQIFIGKSSFVEFRLYAEIINPRTGRIIASKRFCVTEKACPNPPGGVVAANSAVAIALNQLARFVVRVI